jgi:hypothetical protein
MNSPYPSSPSRRSRSLHNTAPPPTTPNKIATLSPLQQSPQRRTFSSPLSRQSRGTYHHSVANGSGGGNNKTARQNHMGAVNTFLNLLLGGLILLTAVRVVSMSTSSAFGPPPPPPSVQTARRGAAESDAPEQPPQQQQQSQPQEQVSTTAQQQRTRIDSSQLEEQPQAPRTAGRSAVDEEFNAGQKYTVSRNRAGRTVRIRRDDPATAELKRRRQAAAREAIKRARQEAREQAAERKRDRADSAVRTALRAEAAAAAKKDRDGSGADPLQGEDNSGGDNREQEEEEEAPSADADADDVNGTIKVVLAAVEESDLSPIHYSGGAIDIVELSRNHVEPITNILAAVCYKTLFGDVDLGLVLQWVGT